MTGETTAITEKRPNRLGGCVGVFFQLFDWNRRFAKRKLFSRKSLLPGKQASKRFGGNDKMLKSKLNLIDDEKREVVEVKKHEMRSPSLVARLMGLDSMPPNLRDKGKKSKKKPSLFDEGQGEEADYGFDKSRPQKLQRTTGLCDRRVVVNKKFGSEALQIKNVLTRVRKHHQYNQHQKLASPVRSPRLQRRSSSSRLIDAAARILEPGNRNAKCAIVFPTSLGTRRFVNAAKDPVNVVVSSDNSVASCKACGSLVDVHVSSLVDNDIGKNVACVSESTPFERSKRNVFWRNQQPSAPKGRDYTAQMERKALNPAFNRKHGKDEMAFPGVGNRCDFRNQVLEKERFPPESRSHIVQSKRSCLSPANALHCKGKEFIAVNSVEDFSNRSPVRKRRLACVSGHEQGSSSVNALVSPMAKRLVGECPCARSNETATSSLELGSPHSKCRGESKERKGVQRFSNQVGKRNPRTPFQKRPPLDAGTLGFIQQKLKEIASQEEDAAIRGSGLPNKSASLILHELLSSLAREQSYTRDTDMSSFPERKGKTEMWSDYTSPGSVLDASFSNESCFSNSFDNIPVPGQMRQPQEAMELDWDILEDAATWLKKATNGGSYQAIASLVSHVSHVMGYLSNSGLILTQQRFSIAREVIIHAELIIGVTTRQEKYLIGLELFDELMIYAARSDNLVNLPGITGGFLVDAMIEHLEQKNISCGLKLSGGATTSGLIQNVLAEVPKWAELARVGTDEIVGMEMEKWMDLETHLFGVGSEIAYEILRCLVGELTLDLF